MGRLRIEDTGELGVVHRIADRDASVRSDAAEVVRAVATGCTQWLGRIVLPEVGHRLARLDELVNSNSVIAMQIVRPDRKRQVKRDRAIPLGGAPHVTAHFDVTIVRNPMGLDRQLEVIGVTFLMITVICLLEGTAKVDPVTAGRLVPDEETRTFGGIPRHVDCLAFVTRDQLVDPAACRTQRQLQPAVSALESYQGRIVAKIRIQYHDRLLIERQ